MPLDRIDPEDRIETLAENITYSLSDQTKAKQFLGVVKKLEADDQYLVLSKVGVNLASLLSEAQKQSDEENKKRTDELEATAAKLQERYEEELGKIEKERDENVKALREAGQVELSLVRENGALQEEKTRNETIIIGLKRQLSEQKRLIEEKDAAIDIGADYAERIQELHKADLEALRAEQLEKEKEISKYGIELSKDYERLQGELEQYKANNKELANGNVEKDQTILFLEEKIERIEKKFDKLSNKLEKHIDFIDNTYEGLRNPIEGVKKFLGK